MYDQHMTLRDEIHQTLLKRGYDVTVGTVDELVSLAVEFHHDLAAKQKREAEEASTDFDRWMLLAEGVNDPQRFVTVADIRRAFNGLIDLLQPPSVREARAKSAASE